MNNFDLFSKNVATFETVNAFADTLATKKFLDNEFKKSVTLKADKYSKYDTMLAYSGTTQAGDLISIWSRIGSKRKKADYGVRISEELVKKLSARSKALETLLSQFRNSKNYADSDEYRVSFTNIADVEHFLNTLFTYTESAKQTKAIKESETISA